MLGKVALVLTILTAVLAGLMYSPSLPDELEDRGRHMVMVGLFKSILLWPLHVKEFLGYGDFYNLLGDMTDPMISEGPPTTSGWGVFNVTRKVLDGVPVIMYQPKDMTKLYPAVVYMHGGGFIFGTADSHDPTVHFYAECAGVIGINVDYRRAPVHPYPAAFNDVYKVTAHLLRHGKKYGIDTNKIGLMGESCGANLATTVSLKLTQERAAGSKLPPVSYQGLFVPILQSFDLRLPSYIDYGENIPHLPARLLAAYNVVYMGLGEKSGAYASAVMVENRHICPEMRENATLAEYLNVKNLPERFQEPKRSVPSITTPCDRELFNKIKDKILDPYAFPLMAPNLSGLPPALVYLPEFDLIRDEALLYHHRLKQAGVETKLYISKGLHAENVKALPDFLSSSSGKKANKMICDFMNEQNARKK